jgi:hypothetical protein
MVSGCKGTTQQNWIEQWIEGATNTQTARSIIGLGLFPAVQLENWLIFSINA